MSSDDPIEDEHDGQHSRPELSSEELQAAVSTAHLAGRRITSHSMGRDSIRWAVEAGVDSIEHGIYLNEELAALMLEYHTALIPTLSGYHQTTLTKWSRGEGWITRHGYLTDPHRESVRTAIGVGVPIGIGTDTLGDYVEELEMLVDCGMSTTGALAAACLASARILGVADQIGSLELGKVGDAVVVGGDPISDLAHLRHVEYVVQGGQCRRPADISIATEDETESWTTLGLAD